MFGLAAVLVTSWCGSAPPVAVPRAVARAVAPRCDAIDGRYQIKLPKPLGMLLEERDQGGVSVEELVEGGSAFESAIMPGDVLIAVGVDDVSSLPFEAVMGAIGEAPAELVLTFDRPAAPATAPPAAAPPAAAPPPAPPTPSGPVVVSTDSGESIALKAGTTLLRKALLDAKVHEGPAVAPAHAPLAAVDSPARHGRRTCTPSKVS